MFYKQQESKQGFSGGGGDNPGNKNMNYIFDYNNVITFSGFGLCVLRVYDTLPKDTVL